MQNGAATCEGDDSMMMWDDVFSERQDDLVAMLAAIDERHEKHMEIERTRPHDEPDMSTNRPHEEAQFPPVRIFRKAQRPSEMIHVIVDNGDTPPAPAISIFNRKESGHSRSFVIVPCGPSCVLAPRLGAGGSAVKPVPKAVLPTPTPPGGRSPSEDPAAAMATSSAAQSLQW
ncbi:hypothetical protein HPB50_007590 [Hyalomma asiaticum]|uniref:Uncharacterized protein n=1 Tax=Hyalomma asiaticum TaxID=266040 RepID=A0ACB7TGR8_HYAAI|nr:hypothetical protein HPB50_007590 [Hyalomma asiaticum]